MQGRPEVARCCGCSAVSDSAGQCTSFFSFTPLSDFSLSSQTILDPFYYLCFSGALLPPFSLLTSSPCIHSLVSPSLLLTIFFPDLIRLPRKTVMQAILSEGCRDCCCKVYRHTGGSKGFKRAANAHAESLHHWAHLLTQPSPYLQDDYV